MSTPGFRSGPDARGTVDASILRDYLQMSINQTKLATLSAMLIGSMPSWQRWPLWAEHNCAKIIEAASLRIGKPHSRLKVSMIALALKLDYRPSLVRQIASLSADLLK